MKMKERYIRYLSQQGWERDHSAPQSRKYDKYNHPRKGGYYWLGNFGSIRFNFDNKVSTSFDCTFRVKPMMITWEKAQGYGE